MRNPVKNTAKCFMILTLALFMAASAPSAGLAADLVETDRETGLTLEYAHDGKSLPGAEVELYRTADITESGEYILSGDFSSYSVNLKGLDAGEWRAAAGTLATYVTADKPVPLRTGATDSSGRVSFEDLSAGLYLVKAGKAVLGGRICRSEPFLVSLPSLEEDTWNYQVTARPKTSLDDPDPDGPTDSPSGGGEEKPSPTKSKLTVIKVWNDDGGQKERPSRIRVELLKDGETYSEITLSSSNHWRHTWSGLEEDASWEVVESKVPDTYQVTYTDEGSVYTITNSLLEEFTDGEVPLGALTTIEDGPVPLSMLPQTGLLWWPVPLLVMAGLLLFGIGYKVYFGGRNGRSQEKR